jgi:hypothetical protein
MFNMSKIMKEAHAAAKLDLAWDRENAASHKPYSYYLGLQMRNSFANVRAALTGMAAGFKIIEPAAWLGFSHR